MTQGALPHAEGTEDNGGNEEKRPRTCGQQAFQKLQIPRSKLQRSTKLQDPNRIARCQFRSLADLNFSGAWGLESGISFSKDAGKDEVQLFGFAIKLPGLISHARFRSSDHSKEELRFLSLFDTTANRISKVLGGWNLVLHARANASDCCTNESPRHSPSAVTIFFGPAAAFCAALRSA